MEGGKGPWGGVEGGRRLFEGRGPGKAGPRHILHTHT